MWLGIYGIKDASRPPSEGPVMSGLLANACPEEPDALVALVRVCGGAPRVTGGSTRKSTLSETISKIPILRESLIIHQ